MSRGETERLLEISKKTIRRGSLGGSLTKSSVAPSDSVSLGSTPSEDHSGRASRDLETKDGIDRLPIQPATRDRSLRDLQPPSEILLRRREMSRKEVERESDREETPYRSGDLEIPPEDPRASESLLDRVRTKDPRILRDDPDLRSDRHDSRLGEAFRHGRPPLRSRRESTSPSDARAGIER